MIVVMVRFQYENEFNEARLQQIAKVPAVSLKACQAFDRKRGLLMQPGTKR